MAQQRVGIRNGALFNPTSTLWNNLLTYYTADGTPNDALGTYNGTLVNGTTYGTGIISNGFSLDGVNDYVDLGDNLDFDGSTPFSVSSWINLTNVSGFKPILSKFSRVGTLPGYEIQVSGNKIRVFLSSNLGGGDYLTFTDDTILSVTTWYNITFTYDGSKTVAGCNLYVNASTNTKSAITDTLTGSISSSGTINTIGARSGGQFFMNGIIDEVGVWNRVLTSTEVTELYNSGTGKQYPN